MKPIASLSLDLDNKWSYLKTHGDPGWETFPSYLDLVVPRILDFLQQRKLTITFFIVGQDAALEKNRSAIRAIADAGHEIGNHSFKHEQWLHRYSKEEMETELNGAERHIKDVTGRTPIGFRGPGFSVSRTSLEALKRRGYQYDATTCPNLLMPLARTYFLMANNFNRKQKPDLKTFFPGTFGDAMRPVKPYRWQIGRDTLVEIPVTTMPILRLPIHFSYLLYLSVYGLALARWYFRAALAQCRATGTQPSLLLHPLDFISAEEEPDLSFFPAMKLPSEKKLDMLSDLLELLAAEYTMVTMQQHARHLDMVPTLPVFDVGSCHSG